MICEKSQNIRPQLVLAATCILRFMVGGMWASVGVLYVVLYEEFHQSAGETAFVPSLFIGVSYAVGPIAGILSNKHGTLFVTCLGGVAMAAGMISTKYVSEMAYTYVTLGIVCSVGVGFVYIASFESIKGSFTKYRKFALGICASIGGAGSAAFPVLMQYLVNEYTWSGMCLIIGGLFLNAIPLGILVKQQKIPINTTDIPSKEAPPRQCTHYEFLKDPDFYTILVSGLVVSFGASIIIAHLSAYAISRDIMDELSGAMLYTVLGITTALAKFGHGILISHKNISARWTSITLFLVGGATSFVLLLDIPIPVIYVYVVVFGCCYSAFGGAVLPALILEQAGDEHFTFSLGLVYMVGAVGQLLGPPSAGWMYDALKSYKPPFAMAAVSILLGGLVLLLTCRNKRNVTERETSGQETLLDKVGNGNGNLTITKPGTILLTRTP